MLLERRTQWPRRVDEPPRTPPGLDGAAAVVTFIGHATFLIQAAAGNILTDPMGIDEPLRALDAARRARNIAPSHFRTLGFGESVRLENQRR